MKFYCVAVLTYVAAAFAQINVAKPPQPIFSHPRWAIQRHSGKGDFWDNEPSCHELEYFLRDAKRFDLDDMLTQSGPKDKVEVKTIGTLEGFSITQVLHTPEDEEEPAIKLVLIERKPDQFCEIFQSEYDFPIESVEPLRIVDVESQKVLMNHERVSGNGNFYLEEYWTFDKKGPISLDLGVIDVTLREVLPPGDVVRNGGGFDIEKLCYAMPVWKKGDSHGEPTGGVVQIRFALQDRQLVAVRRQYDPNPPQSIRDNPMSCTLK